MDHGMPGNRLGCNSSRRFFFAWLPVSEGYTSEQFSDLLLEKANVAVAAGNGFGKYGEGYVRVGLLTSEERLKEAAYRIGKLNLFTQKSIDKTL